MRALLLAGVVALGWAGSASADVLYNNPVDLSTSQAGNCVYNTTCAASFTPNTYGVQEFTLNTSATISSVGFNAEVFRELYGTTANYIFLSSTSGQTPSTILESGTSALSHSPGPVGDEYNTTNYAFDVTSLTLDPGDYFVAIQDVTINKNDYLSLGTATSGSFETSDNGMSFRSPYGVSGFFPLASVAVSIDGTVLPTTVTEPASLALLALPLGAAGLIVARRRRRAGTEPGAPEDVQLTGGSWDATLPT